MAQQVGAWRKQRETYYVVGEVSCELWMMMIPIYLWCPIHLVQHDLQMSLLIV